MVNGCVSKLRAQVFFHLSLSSERLPLAFTGCLIETVQVGFDALGGASLSPLFVSLGIFIHPLKVGIHNELSRVLDVQLGLVSSHPKVDGDLLLPIEDDVEAFVSIQDTVL